MGDTAGLFLTQPRREDAERTASRYPCDPDFSLPTADTAGHCFHDVNRVPVSGPVPYATTATLTTVPRDQRASPGDWFDLVDLLSPAPGETRDVIDVQQSITVLMMTGRRKQNH